MDVIEQAIVAMREKYGVQRRGVELADAIELAKLRTQYLSRSFNLETECQKEVFMQLVREKEGAFPIHVQHFLGLGKLQYNPSEKRQAEEEVGRALARALKLGPARLQLTKMFDGILPFVGEDGFHRTLEVLYTLISSKHQLYRVIEAPPPPN